ncbi:Tetratricopeptide repeat protein [Tenacibaculum sp. 190130A14a]
MIFHTFTNDYRSLLMKKNYTYYAFLLFICSGLTTFNLNAQEKDTLFHKSYTELRVLINQHTSINIVKAEKLAQYYINKAKTDKELKEEFYGLNQLINFRIKQRNFDGFVYEKERLISIAETLDLKKELTLCYFYFGYSYFLQGLWKESIDDYNNALTISREIGFTSMESASLTQLGTIKSYIGDYNGALKAQKKALQLNLSAKKDPNNHIEKARLRSQVASLYYISLSYLKIKEKDSALWYVNKALSLNTTVKDTCLNKALYRNLGLVKILQHNFDEAILQFDRSKKICLPISKSEKLALSSNYGRAYIGKKEYHKAIQILQKGLDDYVVKPEEEGLMEDHYKLLAKAYKYYGDIEKSNIYFEKYIHTTNEFRKIQDKAILKFKDEELENFKAELHTINSEKNSLQYAIWLTLLISSALVGVILKLYNNQKKHNRNFKETIETNNNVSDNSSKESGDSEVNNTIKIKILENLKRLEEQEYYLKKECNSYNLAKKIDTNTTYLSKVINSHYQKNFNGYINDLRINYVIKRLKNDTQFRQYSIQSIAEEIGYKSADSFSKYFKKKTGLNPSFYIKELNNPPSNP